MIIENYLTKKYMVWIDTCSILHDSFRPFMDAIIPTLMKYGQKIYIVSSVESELKKHAYRSDDEVLRNRATEAISEICYYQSYGVMDKYNKNSHKRFADNELMTVFTELRIDNNLLLITQDKNLCSDIRLLSTMKSVNSMDIEVFKLIQDGRTQKFYIDNDNSFEHYRNNKNKRMFNNDVFHDYGSEQTMYEQATRNYSGKGEFDAYEFGINFGKEFGEMFCKVFPKAFMGHGCNMNNINGDVTGIYEGDIKGNVNGNVLGIIKGDIEGCINGNVIGTIKGNVEGDIRGNVNGIIEGDIAGNIEGNINGIINGDVEGNIYGDVSGYINGDVEGVIYGTVTGTIDGDYHISL
ncbi:MAG: hypothetical protein ACI4A3_07770 [Lachnospiraceae bacterium]